MDSEAIATFVALTSADEQKAAQYLSLTEGNVEQAVSLFFDSDGGLDLGNHGAPNEATAPLHGQHDPITIPDDDDDDVQMLGEQPASTRTAPQASYEDDEAMARRLQEEAYGSQGGAGDDGGVRAPIGRTTETLVGGPADWRNDPEEMRAAIAEQMMNRQSRFRGSGRPGIFNQQASVWDNSSEDPQPLSAPIAPSIGGLPQSKANMLAEMYRPPFEIMSRLNWDEARDEGKGKLKWLLINVQDQSIFDCQVLNRDIWKNDNVKETVRENFIFLQYQKDDSRGDKYMQYYFHNRESQDAYPHIAIVDPRTGEQVKVWSGPPVPKPLDFLGELHEFLDRYSLQAHARNPVATKKPEKKQKDVSSMTEEEMLEMALQNSLDSKPNGGPRDDDPDALTRSDGKGKAAVRDAMDTADMGATAPSTTNGASPSVPMADTTAVEKSPFGQISATSPHTEPEADPTTTTRIQFRSSGSRVIRRFALTDGVVRLYEWLKASPLAGKEGLDFELSFMGRNLIEDVQAGKSIEDAGLKNGTVMIEFSENND